MGKRLIPGIDKIPESWVKARVKQILSEFRHIKVDMPPANIYGNAGRHDFIICQRGYFWTIETKAGYNTPSALQISYAEDIMAADGTCYIINEFNFSRVFTIAEAIDKGMPIPLSDDFKDYKGGKEYACKTWGASFSSQ